MEFDVIHFEALGAEAEHLEHETVRCIESGLLPPDHKYLITPETLNSYIESSPDISLPRIITIKTHSRIPDGYLQGTRKSIITRSAGYDHVEHLAQCANIASLREYCVNAVAQTAMKFIYATSGLMNHYAEHTTVFDRKSCKAFKELGSHLVATVFGVGKIGRRIYDLAHANGLTVQGVDVRAAELNSQYGGNVNFISKSEASASSHIIINAMNLTRDRNSPYYNVGYFSREFFESTRHPVIFINVTRGEIASEEVLLEMYAKGRLYGVGLDVFSSESEFATLLATGEYQGTRYAAAAELVHLSMTRSGNVYVQPHQGFNSDIAAESKAVEALRHLTGWYRKGGSGFDEQLPYY